MTDGSSCSLCNDVYNNTKIIIVSDHGSPVFTKQFGSTTINAWYNALLLYKDFNSEGELKIDTNFSTIADVPYLLTKHIAGIRNPFTGNLITNDYKTNGVYMVHADWDPRKQYSNRYNFNYYYYVRDNIFDTNNWKVLEWME